MLSFAQFYKHTRGSNVIPVYKQINADLDTPVSAFLKIHKSDYAFLLESVEGREKIARYSFLGSDPALVCRAKGRSIELIDRLAGTRKQFVTDSSPLEEIKKLICHCRPAQIKGLPRFCGGLVGYMGYDMVRFFERLPDKNPDTLATYDAVFMLTDSLLVFDHLNHTIKIISNVMLPETGRRINSRQAKKLYLKALQKIAEIERSIHGVLRYAPSNPRSNAKVIKVRSNITRRQFQDAVKSAKARIKRGDIIQVVLSQRFSARVSRPAFDIYRNLRSLNPSPYMFYLHCGDTILIGASPEMLVRCEDGRVQTRPIAGTRPRGKNEEADARLEEELLNDAKEKAEHIMLVDLGRNDLGRVCSQGQVKVSEFMKVERYSHVMHLVSEVSGVLKPRADAYDALQACFPAGTVSGSPKIRAMEIIDQLENTRRGPYAGCVGYFSFSQNMDTCITIRTIVVKDGVASVQAGAGIVADSIPANEYNESVNKAKALIEALVA